MKSSLFISTKPPYSSQSSKEALDAALASAAFGVQVALLFLEDGVFQLQQNQQPDSQWLKRTAPIFQSLELYDISEVFVCDQDLAERGLTPDHLIIPVTTVTAEELGPLLTRYDNLLTF